MNVSSEDSLSPPIVDQVKSMNMYFAHMSVGDNILGGLSRVDTGINVIDLDRNSIPDFPALTHSSIGENTKPFLKIDDFERRISESDWGDEIDVAFLKLCYLDFNSRTDAEALFNHYVRTIASLREKYPHIRFVHFTVPLTTRQSGLKAIVKKIIGRELYGHRDNLVRQHYNEMVRNNFRTVFDLARMESTRPDGSRTEHMLDGEVYYSLYSRYTHDGGHVNEEKSEDLAKQLILLLSQLKQE